MSFKSKQEEFWAGEFGDQYSKRNLVEDTLPSKIAFFSRVLARTQNVSSVLELGANVGTNMQALKTLLPHAQLSAVEINATAVAQLGEIKDLKIHHSSILDFVTDDTADLVLIKGVLIHIDPDELQAVYEKLYSTSSRYICVAEYYNRTPVTLNYRGHDEKLYRRDFAGELLDKYANLSLIDYGFIYHRDNNFKQDDITWFLMEK